MIEDEWLCCEDPMPMLKFLRAKASNRKLRLFASACCRRIWHCLSERSHEVVMLAERFADGLAGDDERLAARQLPSETGPDTAPKASVARFAESMEATPLLASTGLGRAEEVEQARLLRDIFGNPFRPSPPLPPSVLAWNDGTVRRIAEGIYEERRLPEGTLDSGRLAILSDALLDAGCDNGELIAHLRSPGPHVRGCWAIDQILAKE